MVIRVDPLLFSGTPKDRPSVSDNDLAPVCRAVRGLICTVRGSNRHQTASKQGGLQARWSPSKVVSKQGGLQARWSPSKMVHIQVGRPPTYPRSDQGSTGPWLINCWAVGLSESIKATVGTPLSLNMIFAFKLSRQAVDHIRSCSSPPSLFRASHSNAGSLSLRALLVGKLSHSIGLEIRFCGKPDPFRSELCSLESLAIQLV
ncbi:hypothetical protein B0O80DRAFT_490300 [Mortierella sp. GBAus27b]|nr:hypothetical protein B0O80DRAFT_490300 [Mortierella sp. GBAus27b]